MRRATWAAWNLSKGRPARSRVACQQNMHHAAGSMLPSAGGGQAPGGSSGTQTERASAPSRLCKPDKGGSIQHGKRGQGRSLMIQAP